MWDSVLQFLNDWQLLIGTATPISVWFITDWVIKKRRKKEDLYLLEKEILICINATLGFRNAISSFLNVQLSQLLKDIELRRRQEKYSLDTAFFPLLNTQLSSENTIKLSTGSGYLDTKLLQVHLMTRDIEKIIEDLRLQFLDAIKVNQEIAIRKLNPPDRQTMDYKENLERFSKFVKDNFFDKSVKVYIQTLTTALAGIEAIVKLGRFRWRLKFESSFKFFKNFKLLKKHKKEAHNRIDIYLEDVIKNKIEEIESKYLP
ncbi:hypothetical protein KKA15_07050 [Patescibacteria group bacterium]|nr:hypothetical protein [Patescibacteria group bacterium]